MVQPGEASPRRTAWVLVALALGTAVLPWVAPALFCAAPPSSGALDYGLLTWFDDKLAHAESVPDSELHKLSKWVYMNESNWLAFVSHHLGGFDPAPPTDRPFDFLEVGCGVGAFARVVHARFPLATIEGVDLSLKAVRIARQRVPSGRFHMADARDLSFIPSASKDFLAAPGVLGYITDLWIVREAVAEMVRVLRPGGSLMASMLSPTPEGKRSQNIAIPISFWRQVAGELGLDVVRVDDMSAWRDCVCEEHQSLRYAIFLRKRGAGRV